MHGEDETNRSLTQHRKRRFHASQLIAVALLIISIVIAVGIGLFKGWEDIGKNADTTSSESLFSTLSESAAESKEILQELGAVIGKFRSLDEASSEQVAATVPEQASSTPSVPEESTYINYDWGVAFSLPQGWDYDRQQRAFVAKNETVGVERKEDFNIPEDWVLETKDAWTTYRESTDDGTIFHHLLFIDSFTFVFTTDAPLSDEAHTIIMSLEEV